MVDRSLSDSAMITEANPALATCPDQPTRRLATFTLRLGGPFNIEISRRSLSVTDLLSGAISMLTLPRHCLVGFGDYKQKDWNVNAQCRFPKQSTHVT